MEPSKGKRSYKFKSMEEEGEEEEGEEEEDDDVVSGVGFSGDDVTTMLTRKKRPPTTVAGSSTTSTGGSTGRRSGGSSTGGSSRPSCQADDCSVDLTDSKHYHRRHKICEYHAKATVVTVNALQQRFCQQCSRLSKP